MQDILDMDSYLKPHADTSIDTGIRLINSMTFKMKSAAHWNAIHPHDPVPVGTNKYSFHYKLSM